MKKIILSISFLAFFFLAPPSSANDCSLFDNETTTNYAVLQNYSTITKSELFNEKLIKTALVNLHHYCCSKSNYKNTNCQALSKRENYPESEYLFDHFYDVLMRRVSNQSNEYPDFPRDPQAQKRSEKLEKLILSPQGALPTEFNQDYSQFRAYQKENILPVYHGESLDTYAQYFLTEDVQLQILTYSIRNLRTKYLNSCSLATYLTILAKSDSKTQSLLTQIQASCKERTRQLLDLQHQNLLQAIKYKSNKLLTNTMREYSEVYFNTRLKNFHAIINQLLSDLQGVVRITTHLTPICN